MNKTSKLKYLIAVVLATASLIAVSKTYADAPVVFSIPSGSGSKGSTVSLNIHINKTGAAQTPSVLMWDVMYDPNVISAIDMAEIPALYDAGVSTSCYEATTGDYQCTSDWSQSSVAMSDVLDVATIKFTISNSTSANSTAINLSQAIAATFDTEYNPIYLSTQVSGGTITISSPFATADLNQDGKVNSVDAAMLMGAWGLTSKPKADINQDGAVNSVDAAMMMGQWSS